MVSSAKFQREILRRRLWAKQREICDAIDNNRSIAIRGCHGSGKTYCVSGLIPRELLAYDEAIVLVVAPTLRQVKTFWGEVTDAIAKLPFRVPVPTTTRWEFTPKLYAQGFSSSKGVNAQGFHGKRVLILADEAIGIGSDVWDAIEGVRAAGDVRIVKLCNPTVPEGPVYEDFTKNVGIPGHATLTISAFDTPNLIDLKRETDEQSIEALMSLSDSELDVCPAPWLTRRRWVYEMVRKWGTTNPRFISRVLGRFPEQATDAVFQLAWIEQAGQPYEAEEFAKQATLDGVYIQVGIDVAGPGDDETAACARLGHFVVDQRAWSDADPLDKVESFLGHLKARFPRARLVLVGDTVGIGYYFMRALARRGYTVWPFVAGAAPVDPVMFVNRKAEEYFRCREWMRGGFIRGILDEDTRAQLSDVRYRETAGGRIEIESKDEARSRGSGSPDRAEALIMSYAKVTPASHSVTFMPHQVSPV